MEDRGAAIRRVESQIQLSWDRIGSRPASRHRRAWLPANPHRSMILVHGYAEHAGRYDEMALHFACRGFAVHAYDQSGHGRSAGPRGHVDRFDRMLDELVAFTEFVRAEHEDLPLALVGHSMGGLVAAATSAFRPIEIDHLILSGALLELGPDTKAWKRIAARLLAPLGARMALSAGIDPDGLSRDVEVRRRYQADPYVKDRMSAAFASGMMSMVERTRGAANQIETPVLLMHGESDPISPPSGTRAFHAGLSPEIAACSRLQIYPGLRHEIFQEPERREVWQDILEWIEKTSSRLLDKGGNPHGGTTHPPG
jgi:alpha-beta hydrolase superfamily lysophospholipase